MQKASSKLIAQLASILALLISPLFSIAYFRAYGNSFGEITPDWLLAIGRALPKLLDFAQSRDVYQTYGRIFSIILLLTIPRLIFLINLMGNSSGISRWGARILSTGVIISGVGISAEYWLNPNSWWSNTGFGLEILGALLLWLGAITFGIATFRSEKKNRFIGIALIAIAPLGIIGMFTLGHIPSGPVFGYFAILLILGRF